MQPSSPEPTARRPVWMWAGAAAGLAIAVGMFLVGSRSRTPAAASRQPTETFVASGTVLLGDGTSFVRDDRGGCAGTGDHAGIRDGAPVIITTGDSFAGGKLTDARVLADGTCQFRFSVPGVPARQDAYLLTVADRDPRQYIEHELRSALLALRVD
ncbi:hypothetical protein [Micromonospora okii]|uniref:hypothetical protein n=1 Tax=Micromonospora okii TaxID=1182970 RepID=UPI001E2CFA3D|nr:hypothetical protein [Micromonospora okii]